MDTLIPTLIPADWPQRDSCTCRNLLEGLPAPDLPLVAFTQQVEPMLVYIGPERLAWLGLSAAEVEARAVENLARQPSEWRTVQHATPSGAWLALEVHEGPLAAERILDSGALRQLGADRVGSQSLALATPYRGLLLATSAAMALETELTNVVRALYEEARETGAMALTPRVFLAEQGTLVGMLS